MVKLPFRLAGILALLCTTGAALSAQVPAGPATLGPRTFDPPEYTGEYYLDLDALQDTRLWDSLERSVFSGVLFVQFRKAFGFRLQDVRRVRSVTAVVRDNAQDEGRMVWVTTLQGGATIGLPDAKQDGCRAAQIAGRPVVLEEGVDVDRAYLLARPGCLVVAPKPWIEDVLQGRRRGGVIRGDLLPLVARRQPLAYLAMSLPKPDDPRYARDIPLEANWLTEEDPLRHVLLRLEIDPKTEEVRLIGMARFTNGKQGPELLESKCKNRMKVTEQQLANQPFGRTIKQMFERVVWKRSGVDLQIQVTLPRDDLITVLGGGGSIAWMLTSMVRNAVPAQVVVQPQPKANPKAPKDKPKPAAATRPAKKGATTESRPSK
ncbi:MAG: hypothetical protein H6836_04325 [Planctomycetes bacterium]|nr:hypothetical protein [Planctomycetota bacterium]MCB9888780.1 hypothetical protein [Planctomycetota bacterium]